jgi:hypothetical protein
MKNMNRVYKLSKIKHRVTNSIQKLLSSSSLLQFRLWYLNAENCPFNLLRDFNQGGDGVLWPAKVKAAIV